MVDRIYTVLGVKELSDNTCTSWFRLENVQGGFQSQNIAILGNSLNSFTTGGFSKSLNFQEELMMGLQKLG